MTTPFFALLPGVATSVSATPSATLTCAFLFSVSCSRSCLLTSTGFGSCGIPPETILLSSGSAAILICFLSHVSHKLHCCQRSSLPLLQFRSAPKSGRFASMSTRSFMIHPSALVVLPALALTQPPACFQAMLPARATTMLSPASV